MTLTDADGILKLMAKQGITVTISRLIQSWYAVELLSNVTTDGTLQSFRFYADSLTESIARAFHESRRLGWYDNG